MSRPPGPAVEPVRILVVVASPDARAGTERLGDLVDALAARPDATVEVWFLRCAWNERRWPGSRLVDELRTWPPAAVLDGIGLTRFGAALRGQRLRSWLRRAAPDLVLLDDGLGERVLGGLPSGVVLAHRYGTEPAPDAHLEALPTRLPDVVVVPPAAGPPLPPVADGAERLVEYETRDDWAEARRAGSDASRRRVRRRLGVPDDVLLVTGWGDAGWVDGPDVFVRALWALEDRHGVAAWGRWFGSDADAHEVERLRAEAIRCGLGDRFDQHPYGTLEDRVCGDAVLLPSRDQLDDEQVLAAICSGAAVVTFPVTSLRDPAVRVVDHLDVDGAAAALAEALAEDRDERVAGVRRRHDLQSLLDELVARGRRRRR